MKHSTSKHFTRRRQERNNEVVSDTGRALVAEYSLKDIYTIDVTLLAFRRSAVIGELTTEILEEILTANADAHVK